MKLREVLKTLGAACAFMCLFFSGGCGGSKSPNVVTVSITSSNGTNLILGQSTTLTATVSGATNTQVNWTPVCQFTTTSTDSTGKVTTSKPANCPRDTTVNPQDDNHTVFGVFSNQQPTGTEVFTATSKLPDPKTYPGLIIIATAQSQQDTKKSGTINLTINSGISVSFTPATASLPISEPQSFFASLTNDTGQTTGVTWSLTQQVPNSTAGSTPNQYTPLATCSPACGWFGDNKATTSTANPVIYHAPSSVPTAITPAQKNNTNSPANVTLVAVSNADPSRFSIGTITITPGGPITFNGISPTIAPQGATLWDIYLDAPNISSATQIKLSTQAVPKDSASGQIKVLFPVPTTSSSTSTTPATTCSSSTPCSTGARLRLNASDLAAAGPVTISITDPAETCNGNAAGTSCTASGTGTFTIQPVRATSTATTPDDIVLGSQTTPFTITVDGGYFGPGGNNAAAYFQSATGNTALLLQPTSTSRQLITHLDPINQPNQLNSTSPGLYPLYVRSNGSPAPTPNNPSVTNMAIFPDYSTLSTKGLLPKNPAPIPAGTNPSAVDIDPALGVLVVAETGSNAIEFFKIGSGTLTSVCTVGTSATTCPGLSAVPVNVPMGVAVDRNNHTVAVVNYGTQIPGTSSTPCQPSGQSVTVLGIPGGPNASTAFTVPLPFDPAASPSGALQGSSLCPAPMPYSIGVDPDSHLALVAYSSNSVTSFDNLGFIVNLNPNSGTNNYKCPLTDAITGQDPTSPSSPVGQCLFAQVTLNTGIYPQIAVERHSHRAIVTPGGSGVVRGVDLTKPSTENVIASASLAGGLVTVTVDPARCPLGVTPTSTSTTNPCPLSLVPGAPNSVLITGLVPKNTANSTFFNGVYSVAVTSSNSFTYVVNSTASDTASGPSGQCTATNVCATVFYGQPDQLFGLPSSTQGVAINPITETAAIADANAVGTNGPQIDLLSGLDQSVSSISFLFNCTAFTNPCQSAAELPATTNVAWQPYTNSLVSYNPKQGFVSVSDPVSRKRYAIVSGLGPGAVPITVSNGTTNANTLTLWGGVAVDPNTNQAFVVESGSTGCSTCTPAVPSSPGQIEVINLNSGANTGAAGTGTPVKAVHVSEVIVPSSTSGSSGGVPNALVPQATLTCTPTATATCDLPGVQIFGTGFDSATQVLLDSQAIPSGNVQVTSPQELTVTIPGSLLLLPHHYALTVINGSGAQSNAVDFLVIGQVPLSGLCKDASGNATNTQPTSVAIADQIANGPFSPFALVSVTGCNGVVKIDLNPASPTFGQLLGSPVLIPVGTSPEGIAIWQQKGLAVVANNGAGTASVIDLKQNPPAPPPCAASSGSSSTVPCADVTTGTNPTGVAINEATGAAIVTNFGNNTVTMINLGLLFPPQTTPPTPLPTSLKPVSIGGIQQPNAVAIDPDRGTNNQGIAVVSTVQLTSGAAPTGALAVVEIGTATPALSTTISSGFVSSLPTGIVFDPAVVTNTTNSGVFFANSSGTNAITEFNPDTGGGTSVSVGVNPTSLAINPQTGAMLTANSASNTISIVDTVSSPFKTHQTLGIPGSPTFGVAIDQFTNLAVIVDQANMRVLLFPMAN